MENRNQNDNVTSIKKSNMVIGYSIAGAVIITGIILLILSELIFGIIFMVFGQVILFRIYRMNSRHLSINNQQNHQQAIDMMRNRS